MMIHSANVCSSGRVGRLILVELCREGNDSIYNEKKGRAGFKTSSPTLS